MNLIRTSRLTLREFKPADAEALFRLNSDPAVLRYVLHPQPWTLARAEQFIQHYDLYERYGFGRWALTEKDNDSLIGWCGLKYRTEHGQVDLGYRLASAHRNKGYATEAGLACLEYGFSELGLKKIVASYVPGNTASQRVLQKLGMQACGTVKLEGKAFALLGKNSPCPAETMRPEPHIVTQRLRLRKMHPGDARVMFALNNDPEVLKYTGEKAFKSLEAARDFTGERIRSYDQTGYGRWVVELKETNEVLGWCGLKFEEELNATDLGYRFFRRHWGKGYATEAAAASLEYGFKSLGLERIAARTMKANTASVRVLEKCRMRFIKEEEFALHPGLLYEIKK